MFKKIITLGISISFLSSTLYATPFHNCPNKNGIACEQSRVEVALTSLYLYTYTNSLPTNITKASGDFFTRINTSNKAPWEWGGMIEGRYHFSEKTDLNLNWMHYSVDSQGVHLDSKKIVSSANIKVDSVNLEYGTSVDLSSRSMVRFYAGAQYLKLNLKNSNFKDQTHYDYANDKYRGVGPRIGLDASHKLKGNFSVFANSAATLLLAKHTNTSGSRSSHSVVFSSLRNNRALPEIEAKLGLTFNKRTAVGTIAVSTGWSVVNYFNLANKENLTLNGPFLEARWRS